MQDHNKEKLKQGLRHVVTQKILYILRHGKAEGGADDHERALTDKGRNQAMLVGRYLKSQHIAPGAILCSNAKRTMETAELADLADEHIDYREKLYLAGVQDILAILGTVPEALKSVLIIGHNPGLQELALKCARRGDDTLIRQMAGQFSPCAFAAISFEGTSWAELSASRGTLLDFKVPENLEER